MSNNNSDQEHIIRSDTNVNDFILSGSHCIDREGATRNDQWSKSADIVRSMVKIIEQTDSESRSNSIERDAYFNVTQNQSSDDSEEGMILESQNVYQDEFSNRPNREKVKRANNLILASIKNNKYSCCNICYSKRRITNRNVHLCHNTLSKSLAFYVTSREDQSTANWLTHLKVLRRLRRMEKGRSRTHTTAKITSMFMDELGDRAYNTMYFSAKTSLMKVLREIGIIKVKNMTGAEIVDSVLMTSENKKAYSGPWSILRVMS